MNKVTKNIIANYLGKLWSFVSIFIFVRLYIDLLGIESYSIINFYTVILGLLVFADAGLTATLTRELARDISIETKANLVYTFERIYIGICFLLAILVIIFAPYVADNFLKSQIYPVEKVAYFLKLIGFGVALQLFSTLYEGGVNGLQHQVFTNKVKIIWSTCRAGLVLVPLYFIPKLEIYFWWQIFCNIILLLIFRKKIKILLPNPNPFFSKELLKSISKYALGMMGIALISGINIQIDKLVISKYLSMELFGYYSIASLLAQLPLMIVTPIIIAVFPILALFVSQDDQDSVVKSFHKYSFLITVIVAPIVFCIALYSIPLVTLWTGKADIAYSVDYVVKILIIGGFFLCLQLTPFYLALANGSTKINLYTGIVGLIVIIPLIIYSISHYGMIGAAIPWVIVNIGGFLFVGFYSVHKFLKGQILYWLIWDIFVPITISVMIGLFIETILSNINGEYMFIGKSLLIGVLSVVFNIIIQNMKNPDYSIIDVRSFYELVKGKVLK